MVLFFFDSVVEYSVEGCNYLFVVDVDMNIVDGYVMSLWDKGYGDFVMWLDLDMLWFVLWLLVIVFVMVDLVWEDESLVVVLLW